MKTLIPNYNVYGLELRYYITGTSLAVITADHQHAIESFEAIAKATRLEYEKPYGPMFHMNKAGAHWNITALLKHRDPAEINRLSLILTPKFCKQFGCTLGKEN